MRSATTAPVSVLQRGLWFLDHWNPGSTAYTIPWVFEFDGPIDPDVLEQSIARIVRRHGALRTTFTLGPDGPQQTVHDDVRIPLVRRHIEPDGLDALLAEQAGAGFDLATGPLLRATLVTGEAVPPTLILVVHHIVWDGWSATVFEKELAEQYTAMVEGREPELPELTAQYSDYAIEQSTEDYGEQLDYWRDQLRGAVTHLAVPADRPRPATQEFQGDTQEFTLPPGTADQVRRLASGMDATPFIVQLAAFAALLNRYCGAADLVVGTPVTTRNRPELADLVGYFVNILPIRVRVDRDATFGELVEQVRDTAFDAYAALDVPFDAVIDTLALERTAQHAPLVQVVFGAHAEDSRPLRFGQVTASRRVRHNGTSKFDMTWSTFDDGELRGEVEYSTGLFDAATVARMTDDWRTLLACVLDDPGSPLWKIPIGDTPKPVRSQVGRPRCLHESFEDAADRFPGRPALTFGDESITYAELDERANRLAHALIAAGVRRGDRVGLMLDRTDAVVVTVLAVLKTGAAYVPVDPAAPGDRALFVFGDTGVRVVVTDLGAPAGPWEVFDLAERAEAIAACPASRPGVDVRQEDLAYLIFTSGSTGKPKGVAVAHEHVARLMTSGSAHFGFTETDVWTLFHSYAFDWTVWELWGPLHHGGRLVVVPYLTSRSPEAFAELLAAERVTCLCLTPSALRQLELTLRSAPRAVPDLRWVMLGGEALDPAVVRRWFDLEPRPGGKLCNLYGITETTVHVTTHDLAGAGGFDRSLIGVPMSHLAAMVLDEWLQPCPIGVPGELYIAGGALADGYWGRPGLTAQRFVPNPFGEGRLYRTGDVARRLADGGLEYVGRCDGQVKIRGFRIELGEIEHALGAHPAIDGCVVTVHEPQPQDRRLAAYVTGDRVPDYPDLRAFLAKSLPDHMIPGTVTVLDAIPVTVNGKVDRAALPAPTAGSVSSANTYVAPSTPAERLLVRCWADVLGVPDIGVHDNFFHLGGDSIRAVHLAGRLQDHGWTFTLPELFAAPTPAALAPLLRPREDKTDADVPFADVSEGDRAALPPDVVDAYPMAAMQLGMIYHMELSGDAGGYHNVNSYRVAGRLDEEALRAAVAGVMSRHPVLRTSLEVFGYEQPLQLVHAEAPVPVEVADLSGLSEAAQHDAITEVFDAHCAARFDIRTAPLFRMTAQRLAGDAFQFTIAEHHAILDGWSFTSLLAEILQRHAALIADPADPVTPPPASTFRAFVAAEQAAAESAESEAFWRERLTGTSGALWSDGETSAAAAAEIPRTVERVLPDGPRQLKAIAGIAGVPVKAAALAAHVLALHRITGRTQFTTGLSVNGRLEERSGTEAYGLFLNTVPLPLDLTALGTGVELVRALHEAETALLPHRRMPFARLARFMTGTRLEACFAFLRFHSLDGLSIVDDRIGCEPTMRYEPTNFALGAALVQDPSSGRMLLAVDHLRSLVADEVADDYVTAYAEAVAALTP